MAGRRLAGSLFRLARPVDTVEAVECGDPRRVRRRLKTSSPVACLVLRDCGTGCGVDGKAVV